MKILICYHSQSGNTEKVARAMQESLEFEDVTACPIADVDPTSLKDYDLVIIGSGVYAGSVGPTIKSLLKQATDLPPRFALFMTHANPDPGMWQNAFKPIRRTIEKAGSKVVGEFECLGENTVVPKDVLERVYSLESLPPEECEAAHARVEATIGHPDDGDLVNAREFAKSMLG